MALPGSGNLQRLQQVQALPPGEPAAHPGIVVAQAPAPEAGPVRLPLPQPQPLLPLLQLPLQCAWEDGVEGLEAVTAGLGHQQHAQWAELHPPLGWGLLLLLPLPQPGCCGAAHAALGLGLEALAVAPRL